MGVMSVILVVKFAKINLMTLTDGGLGIGFWIGLINRKNQKITHIAGNREQGTPEEKTSPSSFATSLFVLIGLATAIISKLIGFILL
jgi:hypothetical protein